MIALPPWLKSTHPGFRAAVTLVSLVFMGVQFLANLPVSSLSLSVKPLRTGLDELGLYQRGWGMFAGTNTNTSVVRLQRTYANGKQENIQYIYFAPGYKISVWNEVMQDLQFDDNNDTKGAYLDGFLRYSCKQYDTDASNPLVSVAFQQQLVKIPISKARASSETPFVTKALRQCLALS